MNPRNTQGKKLQDSRILPKKKGNNTDVAYIENKTQANACNSLIYTETYLQKYTVLYLRRLNEVIQKTK